MSLLKELYNKSMPHDLVVFALFIRDGSLWYRYGIYFYTNKNSGRMITTIIATNDKYAMGNAIINQLGFTTFIVKDNFYGTIIWLKQIFALYRVCLRVGRLIAFS